MKKKKCETDLNTGSCTKDIIYLIYFICQREESSSSKIELESVKP